jgi:hypothetical protein
MRLRRNDGSRYVPSGSRSPQKLSGTIISCCAMSWFVGPIVIVAWVANLRSFSVGRGLQPTAR